MSDNKRYLLIMRHAKSDHSSMFAHDFERPLNERGQLEPLNIAEQLKQLDIAVDKVLVSPARRTTETWQLLSSAAPLLPEPIFEPKLYMAGLDDFLDALHDHTVDGQRLLVIAHCPGVIEITEHLTGEYHDFKTASLAVLSANRELQESLSKPRQFKFERMLTAKK